MSKPKILRILEENGESTVNELTDFTHLSRQMVHRILSDLVLENKVEKLGKAPKTYYRLVKSQPRQNLIELNLAAEEFLKKHFLLITEKGQRLEGLEAFSQWCSRQKLPVAKTVEEFISTRKKYLKYFNQYDLINGMSKLEGTKAFEKIYLDAMYYFDFYAIERFGKTRLGTLLHHAKQGQNRKLILEIVEIIREPLHNFIGREKIEAVGFIPPTIQRNVQFMKVMEKGLNLPLPHLSLRKISGEFVVPQKALSKIEDRISNAQVSLMVNERRPYNRILLIDDALGSGATINETAGKLKFKSIAKWIAGIAVTGSYKGFEVIQEV